MVCIAGAATGDAPSTQQLTSLDERRTAFTPLIEEQARRHGIRADLVHAVIRAESAYRPDAVSSKGAVGLMQLMPETAARYGVTDRTDPGQSIAAGAAYLQDLKRRYAGDLELVLAAYNAGEAAVDHYNRRVPPYPETRAYVRRVLDAIEARKSRCWRWKRAAAESSPTWGLGRCQVRSPSGFQR